MVTSAAATLHRIPFIQLSYRVHSGRKTCFPDKRFIFHHNISIWSDSRSTPNHQFEERVGNIQMRNYAGDLLAPESACPILFSSQVTDEK
ncbi:hypothetical protein NPIL_11651 [Nephila pilipes]|uniref:Uncharacterized protein n=1 Tax=Nephila pilipes TaxID=299642 RepID=A0A8X6MW89_NEPPI|nr:hypothetical protein NPIL_11651 [Nephila pilipes]